MAHSAERGLSSSPQEATFIMARSLLLVASGEVRKFEKQSTMVNLIKRMAKWGLVAARPQFWHGTGDHHLYVRF